MSVFKYTLPSGAEYVVRGPSGATQDEADRIFYEQVAAGSLVGYEPGQTLTSFASQVTKFELSRLDRGTAGVDTFTVLAISQGIPYIFGVPVSQNIIAGTNLQNFLPGANQTTDVIQPISVEQTILSAIQAQPYPTSFPNLANVPVTDPIDEADIVNIKGDDFAPSAIGASGSVALNEYQVQKLLAQIAKLVDQAFDAITQNKGLGLYGFTAYALEEAGYVKPGTSLRFFAVDPEDFVAVMSSPSVWTGKNGVYGLNDLLLDSNLQGKVQVQLMQQGYDELLANGTISQVPQSAVSVSQGQVYTNSGLKSLGTISALGLLTNAGSLNGIVRNALTGSTALNQLLSGSNINLSTIGSGATGNLNFGSLANLNLNNITAGISQQLTGSVGALVANAGKFGSAATALWAKSGNLESLLTSGGGIGSALTGQLGSITNLGNLGNLASGGLSSIAGSLTGNLNNITSNLTNLVPGSLGNLTSNLNLFGQAGSFATNFANPLASLNSLGNVGNLGGLLNAGGGIGGALTGQLGSLQGALAGQLGGLTGALSGQLGGLTGALGGLGSFANIGAVGELFGGGGDLVSGTQVAAGFNNTVNRKTVDAAFARIVGSNKIPLPTYQYPSLAALAPRLDIQQAVNFLQNRAGSAGSTFGQTVTI